MGLLSGKSKSAKAIGNAKEFPSSGSGGGGGGSRKRRGTGHGLPTEKVKGRPQQLTLKCRGLLNGKVDRGLLTEKVGGSGQCKTNQ